MKTILIFGKEFHISSKILAFFVERVCVEFSDMAEVYLESDGFSEQTINNFSDEELLRVLEPWIVMECDVFGVNYADLTEL